jgi:uncharacterized MAPEG superfamily protein
VMNDVVLPIVAVGVMPYILTGLSKSKGFGAKENERTRAWQAELVGWRQRAHWAHQNAFEAVPLFAALAILAQIAKPGNHLAACAAWGFVGLRVAYAACYLGDVGRLRSLVWMGSQALLVVLMLVALSVVG